ncbi:Vacuolar ATPase assembly integral membrane protein [Perkinsela sp. CCAP 1560/4]|nr:Vacuolar ATPase assembly integral membrane protein [Perkinsela sp. CCAP 1560/4]|eukprot:KNH05441.1 Vacuolar ATPase assembly integral membrane protein [Perkinsela sp. CCAP 1560/4]
MKPSNFRRFVDAIQCDKNASVRTEFVWTSALIFSIPILFVAISYSDAALWYERYFDPNVNADIFAALVAVIALHIILFRFVWKALQSKD